MMDGRGRTEERERERKVIFTSEMNCQDFPRALARRLLLLLLFPFLAHSWRVLSSLPLVVSRQQQQLLSNKYLYPIGEKERER